MKESHLYISTLGFVCFLCVVQAVGAAEASLSPPRTKPLVAIAEVDRPVMVVTRVAIRIIAIVSPVLKNKIIHIFQVM